MRPPRLDILAPDVGKVLPQLEEGADGGARIASLSCLYAQST